MTDWLDIGSSPPDEDCAQVGSPDYYPRARRECRAYIGQLRRVLGPEPLGAHLIVKSHLHDFGTYLSVACIFDPANRAAIEYAYRCESNSPEEWDRKAKVELRHLKEVPNGNLD
jgi:hypothetical protein